MHKSYSRFIKWFFSKFNPKQHTNQAQQHTINGQGFASTSVVIYVENLYFLCDTLGMLFLTNKVYKMIDDG